MRNVRFFMITFAIFLTITSCTKEEILTPNDNLHDSSVSQRKSEVNYFSKNHLLEHIVDSWSASAPYNNYTSIEIPFFDSNHWSYGTLRASANQITHVPFFVNPEIPTGFKSLDDINLCAADPDDLTGYLPIPSSVYNQTNDFNLTPVSIYNNGSSDLSLDPDDLTGYLPIPSIRVNYTNAVGVNNTVILPANVLTFAHFIIEKELYISN